MCSVKDQVLNMTKYFVFPLYKASLYVENNVQVNIYVPSAPAEGDEQTL